ncbi:MAG: hypothetical protein AB2A00_05180 [Myxococcota bacterium]
MRLYGFLLILVVTAACREDASAAPAQTPQARINPKTLPEVTSLPEAWRACQAAADCAFAGDGCRSCNGRVVVNKRFLEEFQQWDARWRKEANFTAACEACARPTERLACERNLCVEMPPP